VFSYWVHISPEAGKRVGSYWDLLKDGDEIFYRMLDNYILEGKSN